ncbi:hypothetical protein [Paraglaciecola sp.]|uniref:hypothetical protein n=1 Tax=Paraglaciecola sp. TaxID=1920173 RepID=UPI003267D6BB
MIMLVETSRQPLVNKVNTNIPTTNKVGLATKAIMTLTLAGREVLTLVCGCTSSTQIDEFRIKDNAEVQRVQGQL